MHIMNLDCRAASSLVSPSRSRTVFSAAMTLRRVGIQKEYTPRKPKNNSYFHLTYIWWDLLYLQYATIYGCIMFLFNTLKQEEWKIF